MQSEDSRGKDLAARGRKGQHELTEQLASTLDLYAQDKNVDRNLAADRLVDLARGNWAALDRLHRVTLARAREEPEDSEAAQALAIMHQALERAGGC